MLTVPAKSKDYWTTLPNGYGEKPDNWAVFSRSKTTVLGNGAFVLMCSVAVYLSMYFADSKYTDKILSVQWHSGSGCKCICDPRAAHQKSRIYVYMFSLFYDSGPRFKYTKYTIRNNALILLGFQWCIWWCILVYLVYLGPPGRLRSAERINARCQLRNLFQQRACLG